MKPSSTSTSSRRARRREFGEFTFARWRSWPFLMRVSRSPIGSLIAIYPVSLPARLGHARDLAEIRKVAKRDARQLHLAVVALRAARQVATMVDAHLGRVARQLGQLEAR